MSLLTFGVFYLMNGFVTAVKKCLHWILSSVTLQFSVLNFSPQLFSIDFSAWLPSFHYRFLSSFKYFMCFRWIQTHLSSFKQPTSSTAFFALFFQFLVHRNILLSYFDSTWLTSCCFLRFQPSAQAGIWESDSAVFLLRPQQPMFSTIRLLGPQNHLHLHHR